MIRQLFIIITMLLVTPYTIAAPTIEVLALFAGRAMLRIDNQQHMLSEGEVTPEGVTLLSATSKRAVVEYEGKEFVIEPETIIRGEYKAAKPKITGNTEAEAKNEPPKSLKKEVVVSADINDQYLTTVNINGQAVKAIIDTGANTVAMSSRHAETLGISAADSGLVGSAQTASGVSSMYMVKLDKVSLEGIEVDGVDAAVLEGDFPEVLLLGMSFLNHLHIVQEKGVMKLTQKNQQPATTAAASPVPVVTTPPQN